MSRENRIGIIGGGQLGRMMVPDAKRLGFEVTVIDPNPDSPAKQVGAEQIIAPLTDEVATRKLAKASKFITWEIEHINTGVLCELRDEGSEINPSPETLDIIKDKLRQKIFLRNTGIPIAEFAPIEERKDVLEASEEFGFPFLLKSRFGGYDGRGNVVIDNAEKIEIALRKFGDKPIYAERFIPFTKELAIMVARSKSGDVATYPVVETIQKDNICHMVLAPAPVNRRIYEKAKELGEVTTQHLKGAGVFGIEMFMTKDGKVLVNEIAPRVHNSGHYTMDACKTSQFEQQIRAVTGFPLGETDMIANAAVMINILGERQGPAMLTGLSEAFRVPDIRIHIYGKKETRPERKMGHITVRADTLEEAERNARSARRLISI